MVYIDAVHYVRDYYGVERISTVKWTNSLNEQAVNQATKQQMIDFINQNPDSVKTKYFNGYRWIVGENVRVVDNAYLRTDANNVKSDNLGSLPRY